MSAADKEKDRVDSRAEPAEADFLLKPYKGKRPPAPEWFDLAIGKQARTGRVEVDGASINWRQWGDPGKPGMLLAHGNGAHSHWWDFIAPFFAEDWNVVAPDFSGMGDSDWRDSYGFSAFAKEQVAVCEAAGLFAHQQKPIIVAHSFGGIISLVTALQHGDHFSGAVIVDSHIEPPGKDRPRPPKRQRPNRIYEDLTAALARFRLAPLQPCENHFAVDHIARHSIREMTGEKGEQGISWKFDPFLFSKLRAEWDELDLTRLDTKCPIVFMRGEKSELVGPDVSAYMQSLQDPPVPMITIPDAYHHVMLDQPLAFVAAVRGLLAAWPER
ncbi:MAG: alpha/beta hydrolase [Henriciella sp.]|uniref:alpha/beta fold hydrolase n=1 Tax=Henriciella sp. TaxID=1968823 RepID=UPI0032EE33D2